MFWISITLVIFASIFKSIMDTLQFRYEKSIFSKFNKYWWNPNFSWMNKWKYRDRQNGERFFGSSTFFVWVTDAWHFFQHFMITFMIASIVLYQKQFGILIDFAILYLVYTCTFELFFSKIWTR